MERTATPPTENGRRIGTIERSADEEIRVNWCEYEGHPYISIRLWNRVRSGQWWPDGKRGISVRIREMVGFAAAIGGCLDLVEADRQRRQENQANRPGISRWRGTDPLPLQAHEPDEFDEFAT